MLELEDVTKVYSTGADRGARARRGLAARRRGRDGRDHGPLGVRQVDDDEHPRLPGRARPAAHYRLDGVDVGGLTDNQLAAIRNRKIGFVFQSFNLLPRTSAQRNVELPLVYAGEGNRAARARAALERVGLGTRAGHMPNELSGGQQQRVAIARALVNDPAMILADEPTGALDSVSTDDVMRLLVELNEAGRTIVIITHEDDVASFTTRVVTPGRRPDRQRRPAPARGAAVNLGEALRIALRALRANRLRSVLTTTGIIIGVSAVIVLVALGNGIQAGFTEQFSALTTQITVTPAEGDRSAQPLTDADVEALGRPLRGAGRRERDPGGHRAARCCSSRARSATAPGSPAPPRTTRTSPTSTWSSARSSTSSRSASKAKVVVLGTAAGHRAVRRATPGRRSAQRIRIGRTTFRVIGVAKPAQQGRRRVPAVRRRPQLRARRHRRGRQRHRRPRRSAAGRARGAAAGRRRSSTTATGSPTRPSATSTPAPSRTSSTRRRSS